MICLLEMVSWSLLASSWCFAFCFVPGFGCFVCVSCLLARRGSGGPCANFETDHDWPLYC